MTARPAAATYTRWERTGEWRQPKFGECYESDSGAPNIAEDRMSSWHWILRTVKDEPPPAVPQRRPHTEQVAAWLNSRPVSFGDLGDLCNLNEALRRVRVWDYLWKANKVRNAGAFPYAELRAILDGDGTP